MNKTLATLVLTGGVALSGCGVNLDDYAINPGDFESAGYKFEGRKPDSMTVGIKSLEHKSYPALKIKLKNGNYVYLLQETFRMDKSYFADLEKRQKAATTKSLSNRPEVNLRKGTFWCWSEESKMVAYFEWEAKTPSGGGNGGLPPIDAFNSQNEVHDFYSVLRAYAQKHSLRY